VSLRWLRALGDDIDGDGDIDIDDIRAITLDQSGDMFRREFWIPVHGEEIQDQRIANKLVDLAVNSGVRRAVRILQEAIGVADDGRMGPRTIASVNAAEPVDLLHDFCARQWWFYCGLMRADPKKEAFRVGWKLRAAWPWRTV
jgi:lysozyme family protein